MNKYWILPGCTYSELFLLCSCCVCVPTINVTWKRKLIFPAIQHKLHELDPIVCSNLALVQAAESALQFAAYDRHLWNSSVCRWNGITDGAHNHDPKPWKWEETGGWMHISLLSVRRLQETRHCDAFKCHTKKRRKNPGNLLSVWRLIVWFSTPPCTQGSDRSSPNFSEVFRSLWSSVECF